MNQSLSSSLACTVLLGMAGGCSAAAEPIELWLTDGPRVEAIRERALAGDAELQPAVEIARKYGELALDMPMRSVADKPTLPPSGDPNDYVSLSPYFWPNPDTPDGLPYVRRDGEVNPERDDYDMPALDDFGRAVVRLGFAWYFTGDASYAEAAAERLEHFLVDPATRMNPRMAFGQFVPGESEGRHYGIIETLRLRFVCEAIAMLGDSDAMTPELDRAVRRWFGDYARWLNNSEMGVAERDGDNNHATWCKAQIAYYSAFAGDHDTAADMVRRARVSLEQQLEPDGRQPLELARTRALDYSEFNLRAYTELAVIGEKLGVDLWHHVGDDGQSIRRGFDFLLPYLAGRADWPYEQITDPKHDKYAQSLRRLAIAFRDPAYEKAIDRLDTDEETRVILDLVMPLPDDFPSPASR